MVTFVSHSGEKSLVASVQSSLCFFFLKQVKGSFYFLYFQSFQRVARVEPEQPVSFLLSSTQSSSSKTVARTLRHSPVTRHDIGGSWAQFFGDTVIFMGERIPFFDCKASFGSNSFTIFHRLSRRFVARGTAKWLSLWCIPWVFGGKPDPSSQNVIHVPLP